MIDRRRSVTDAKGLRAPAVLRDLLQKDCFASSRAWKLMRQISKEFIATFKTFGHNIKDSAGKETDDIVF